MDTQQVERCTCDDSGRLPMSAPCGCCGLRGPCQIPCASGRPYLQSCPNGPMTARELLRDLALSTAGATQETDHSDSEWEARGVVTVGDQRFLVQVQDITTGPNL